MEAKWIAVNTETRHGLTDQGWQPCYENIHGRWVISTMEPKWLMFKTRMEAVDHIEQTVDDDAVAEQIEFIEMEEY